MSKKEDLAFPQVLSARLQELEEEKARLQQQTQFLTEQAAIALNEKIQVLEELTRRNREMAAITSLAQAIIQIQEPEKVLKVAVEKIAGALGIEVAVIYLWNPERQELKLAYSYGADEGLLRQMATRKLDEGLTGMVAQTRQPFFASDVAAIPPVEGAIMTYVNGIRGFAAVPLANPQGLLGVLAVASPHTWECTPHHMEVLATWGNQIAIALENTRLYQEAKARVQCFEAVNRISSIITSSLRLQDVYDAFVQELRKLIQVDNIAISGSHDTFGRIRIQAIYQGPETPGPVEEITSMDSRIYSWMQSQQILQYQPDLARERKFPFDEVLYSRDGLRSLVRLPLISRGKIISILRLGSHQPHAYSPADLEMLKQLASPLAQAVANDQTLEKMVKRQDTLERSFSDLAGLWVQTWENRFPHIRGHHAQVTLYARRIAQQMGLDEAQMGVLKLAGQLHDIGMVTVPDAIMLKVGKMNPSEQAIIRLHPQTGADMLRKFPIFQEVISIIQAHHEHYNGQGYPQGLRGEDVPLGARILAVAEDYTIMGTELPHHPAISPQQAMELLKKGMGSRWDPQVVTAFLSELGERLTT